MNRQTKRMMEREEARKKSVPRPTPKTAGPTGKRERTKPRQFVKEVIAELRKVAWPTRHEVIAYSIVVLIASIVIAAVIFVMDFVFTEAILRLFGVS